MSSTGNDIVALAAVDRPLTHHNRFTSKILSETERSLYDRQPPAGMLFENFVWLLWSVKESVYKYLKRTEPGLVFSPTRIVIQKLDAPTGDGLYKGKALFGPHSLYFQSNLQPEFIASVVGDEENFDNIAWGIRSIDYSDYHHQSGAVRTFALDHLHSLVSGIGAREDLRIEKNRQGCPILYRGSEEIKIPLSLAHHGHFISWSFYLNREGRSVIS
jgi:phosphopantetheinyl transferase (holo-ACP synthase)